jgi:hypothetical protein
MENNDEFIAECARAAAWADDGFTKLDFSGDVASGMPDGWPEGVDVDAYQANYVEKYVPKGPEHKSPAPTVTPLVKDFRRMIENA